MPAGLNAGPVTSEIPHDLVHFTVEDALGMTDGIWGSIAGGVVFDSMTHVSGRRPPHAAERSALLMRHYSRRLNRAELLGGFLEAAAHRPDAELPRLAAQGLPDHLDVPDPAALARAVAALREVEHRWQSLAVGQHLVLHWPGRRRIDDSPARPRRVRTGARRRR